MINFRGKRVMLTGGTGTMGVAILDYLKDSGAEFTIFSRDEEKQHSLWMQHQHDWNVKYVIGDVRDKSALKDAMRDIDYVLHLAALKHITTGELYPHEVIKTNLVGTVNVVEVAAECEVERLLNWSTDKAVSPINTYGMVKALGERVVANHPGDTININLRYGNVLGSRGSVIPLWIDQIKNNKPLSVTDMRMSRFLLTTRDAVLLSMQALSEGKNGELFVMKPPATTVENMIMALEMNYESEFEKLKIGIRPSEKLFEVLMNSEEACRSTEEVVDGVTYVRIPSNTNHNYFTKGELRDEPKDFTSLDAEQLDAKQVLAKLKEAGLL